MINSLNRGRFDRLYPCAIFYCRTAAARAILAPHRAHVRSTDVEPRGALECARAYVRASAGLPSIPQSASIDACFLLRSSPARGFSTDWPRPGFSSIYRQSYRTASQPRAGMAAAGRIRGAAGPVHPANAEATAL